MAIELYRLENGLKVLLQPDERAHGIGLSVTYDVGRADDAHLRSGLAHLVQFLMLGPTRHDRAQLFERALLGLGASAGGARTALDSTVLYEQIPNGSLERALWLESDRMAYLLDGLDEDRLLAEQGLLASGSPFRKPDAAENSAFRFLARELFPAGHPYHHLIRRELLGKIMLADVQWFFQRYYGPANATVFIVGNFSPARAKALIVVGDVRFAEVVELAQRELESFRGQPLVAPATSPPPPALTRTKRLELVTLPSPSPIVAFALPAPAYESSIAPVRIWVLSEILRERLLVQNRLYRYGSYHVAVRYQSGARRSVVVVEYDVSLYRLKEVAELTLAELDALAHRAPRPEELQFAKLRLLEELRASLETSAGVARALSDSFALGEGAPRWRELEAAIRAVEVDAALFGAAKMFESRNARVVAFGALSQLAALRLSRLAGEDAR